MLAERVVEWTKTWKEQGIEEGRKEGLKEGRKEGLCETAVAMIQRTQFDDATIADLTGLPLAEVQALRNRPTGD
jgi:predicted transposase/invertase (TIGR01784 family)